ncbi:hypothetical protein EMN47_16535 [Prolixibacteraceae bacterium JC049]|nr:hypothetical protein [Prolixibacteraceae bacterium JC049]
MRVVIIGIIFAACCFYACKSNKSSQNTSEQELSPKAIANNFKLIGEAVNEPGYDVWGSSPVRGEDGKVHLFCARWSGAIPFYEAWKYNSEIAHYVANNPEGPFQFENVVASAAKSAGVWNKVGFHNPNIRKIDDKYVLVYIANDGAKQHGPTQFIGMMIAQNINGPWKQIPNKENPILKTPENESSWCFNSGCGVTNPSILAHPNGKYYLYFKAMTGPRPKGRVKMGVAIADKLTGPYVIQDKSITANDKAIEDGYAFMWRNHICLLTTDNHGIIEKGGGLLWVSKDGLQFNTEPLPGFHHFGNYHLKGNIPENAKKHYGSTVKFERPQLLQADNGEIEYLYCPSGVAIDGSDGTNSYVLKFEAK